MARYSLCVRFAVKCFLWALLHLILITILWGEIDGWIYYPIFRWINWSSEIENKLAKVTSGARFSPRSEWPLNLSSQPSSYAVGEGILTISDDMNILCGFNVFHFLIWKALRSLSKTNRGENNLKGTKQLLYILSSKRYKTIFFYGSRKYYESIMLYSYFLMLTRETIIQQSIHDQSH